MHDTVQVGDVLTPSVPFGALALDDCTGSPMVFAGTGTGITPMAGMLSHLARPDPSCRSRCCAPITTTSRGQVLDDIAALPGDTRTTTSLAVSVGSSP
ncbi:hypothetical protein ACIHEJ_01835 [Streptomyces sp. NPDC052301]|uniref:hypothetical protein n=1 Tax=Streptomyces sp. NPDC052301 TaxID=3365687 RepID=UPI0037D856FC